MLGGPFEYGQVIDPVESLTSPERPTSRSCSKVVRPCSRKVGMRCNRAR